MASNQLPTDNQMQTLPSETLAMLDNFWPKVTENISNINISTHFKTQELPLARIKKIMKLDEDVKMISAEAPVLFAKACEIFISELSLRAWIHTEDNKRRTLQKNDVSQAVAKYDQFDFLIDIVPRDEIKPAKREDNLQRASMMPDQVQYYFQLAQQTQQALQQPASTPQQQQIQIQTPSGQIISAQPLQLQQGAQNTVQQVASQESQQPQVIQIQAQQQQQHQQQQQLTEQQQQQQIVQQLQQSLQQSQDAQETQAAEVTDAAGGTQVFQQVVTPSGEVIHMPIQLTQAQLQAIQTQMQGKAPGQPIVIQTGADQQQEAEQQPQPLFQVPLGADGQQILVQESDQEQTLHIKGEH